MAVPAFQLLYMILAIDEMDGYGISNTACDEDLPNSNNRTEHFNYNGEWANS